MVEVYNENIPEEDSKYYGLVVENHYSESGDTGWGILFIA